MDLNILVIEDDALMRKALYDKLSGKGHSVIACGTLAEARQRLEDEDAFDLMLVDMCLPDGNGVEFVGELQKQDVGADTVIMTAFADIASAVLALKNGAYDYLSKPIEDAQIDKILRNVEDKRTLNQQVSSLTRISLSAGDMTFGDMIGAGSMKSIFERADKLARSANTTVLILGESGTGKGVLAKQIHKASPRCNKPFVDVNCSAIPGQLMESELFGYEKGAFTDAKARKLGLLEVAQGGTVFLDEIGDMDISLQGKLLKVLEEKEFRRLGGARSIRVDVRIIAATNRDLKDLISQNKFREDLYYRLSVVPIVMPPLRERRDCIELFAKCFLGFYAKEMGRSINGFTRQASDALMAYAWPGNIRELKNLVERCVILAPEETIGINDLGLPAVSGEVSAGLQNDEVPDSYSMPVMSLAECERKLIATVLQSVDGNKNKAADILAIHRTTLYKKIEEYEL